MTIRTSNTSLQYFNSTGAATHYFTRPINTIIINAADANTTLSLDAYNFMPMAQGTHQLVNLISIRTVRFGGSGARSGWGIAL